MSDPVKMAARLEVLEKHIKRSKEYLILADSYNPLVCKALKEIKEALAECGEG